MGFCTGFHIWIFIYGWESSDRGLITQHDGGRIQLGYMDGRLTIG